MPDVADAEELSGELVVEIKTHEPAVSVSDVTIEQDHIHPRRMKKI